MRPFMPLLLLVPTLAGCGQTITVLACDAHDPLPDGGATDSEANDLGIDGGATDFGLMDAGFADAGPIDTGPTDAGPSDAGPQPCAPNLEFCLDDLLVSASETVVRRAVTITPVLRNPNSLTLEFTVQAEPRTRRRAGLPPLNLSDLRYTLTGDRLTGEVTFQVTDVPTFFATTTFIIGLTATRGTVSVYAEAEVTVRGNVVASDTNNVFAFASDGRFARSVSAQNGRLLYGTTFVRGPRDLLVAQDGTLIVRDRTEQRLKRFSLEAENSQLPDFEANDATSEPLVSSAECRGLAQLPDGRIALVNYDFSRNPKSELVLWHADGRFDRRFDAMNIEAQWSGVAANAAGELLVLERSNTGRIVRLNANDGRELGTIAGTVSSGWNLTMLPNGMLYVGTNGAIFRITPQGARQMVSMVPGFSSDYWQYLAPFGPDGVVSSRDSYELNNMTAIEGLVSGGWWRDASTSGIQLWPLGLATLQ